MYPEDPDEDVSSTSSSSSSDNEEQVDEEKLESDISEALVQIESNPYNYDAHIQLISLLRKSGDLVKLREARERMSSHFPLTPGAFCQPAVTAVPPFCLTSKNAFSNSRTVASVYQG